MIIIVKGLGLGIEIESTPSPRRWQYNPGGHHPHPPTTQLLTMMQHSDKKVPLVNLPIQQNDLGDSINNRLGESNMIKEKVINNP